MPTNNIILDFTTNGLVEANANLKETAKGMKQVQAATDLAVKDVVELSDALIQAKGKLAGMKEGTKEFKDLSNEIKAAEIATTNLTKTQSSLRTEFANTKKEISQLSTTLNDLKKAGLQNTESFKNLSNALTEAKKRGGALKDSISDMGQELQTLGSDTRVFDTMVQGMQGVVGAFQLGTGVSALFGEKNKALEETLVKLNAVMAISQGLQQLQQLAQKETAISQAFLTAQTALYTFVTDGATLATKAFRAALLATGIGAIVVLLGAVIANFDKIKESFSNTSFLGKFREEFFGMLGAINEGLKLTGEIVLEFLTGNFGVAIGLSSLLNEKLKEGWKKGIEDLKQNDLNDELLKQLNARKLIYERDIAILEAKGQDSSAVKLKLLADEKRILELELNQLDEKGKEYIKKKEDIYKKETEIEVLRIKTLNEFQKQRIKDLVNIQEQQLLQEEKGSLEELNSKKELIDRKLALDKLGVNSSTEMALLMAKAESDKKALQDEFDKKELDRIAKSAADKEKARLEAEKGAN